MNLRQRITPKNDDGSIDHRYVPIAKAIAELAGERVEAQLRRLYVATNNLEKESASARLNLRKKGREITMPKLGKRKDSGNVVDLFDEE
jgi:hypothetical protein